MQTIYIVGNPGFAELHHRHLDDSSKFLRGQVSVEIPGKEVQLFWVHKRSALKELKKAIGPELIWKYRLRFYFELEEFTGLQKEKNRPKRRRKGTYEKSNAIIGLMTSRARSVPRAIAFC